MLCLGDGDPTVVEGYQSAAEEKSSFTTMQGAVLTAVCRKPKQSRICWGHEGHVRIAKINFSRFVPQH